MKQLMLALLALTALLVNAQASAACAVSNNLPPKISWGAVTKDTNGNLLTGAVTYSIFMGGTPGSSKTLLVSGLTGTTYTVPGLAPGDYYFQMTADVTGLPSSAMSAEGCKTILPTPPTSPVVTVAKNVYQRQGGKRVLVGTIPLDVKCGLACGCMDPMGRALFSVPRYRVTFTRHDNGAQTWGVCA